MFNLSLSLKISFSANMVSKFRRGLEVLDKKLSLHELFDVEDGVEDNEDILLTDLRSQDDQQKVLEEIGILNISEDDVEENNNVLYLDDRVVDFVN